MGEVEAGVGHADGHLGAAGGGLPAFGQADAAVVPEQALVVPRRVGVDPRGGGGRRRLGLEPGGAAEAGRVQVGARRPRRPASAPGDRPTPRVRRSAARLAACGRGRPDHHRVDLPQVAQHAGAVLDRLGPQAGVVGRRPGPDQVAPGVALGRGRAHLGQQRRQHSQGGRDDQSTQHGPNLHWLCLLTPARLPGPGDALFPTNHRWPDKHLRVVRITPIRNLTYPSVRSLVWTPVVTGGWCPGGGGRSRRSGSRSRCR